MNADKPVMGNRFKAWLTILLAVIAMTAACSTPALLMDTDLVSGAAAATLSAAGTYFAIADGNAAMATTCGLGLLANIIFAVVLIVLILRQSLHWKRPGTRMLALCVVIGTLASLGSMIRLYPHANYVGAWLWLAAQAMLAVGLWLIPRPQRGRGFPVTIASAGGSPMLLRAVEPCNT